MISKKLNYSLVVLVCVGFSSAQAAYELPSAYKTYSACSKQESLWKGIESSKYATLPALSKFGVREALAMGVQAVGKKKNRYSDVAPKGWVKYLHRRGVVSKVKFVAKKDSGMTGLLKGADCGLLRLSVTYRPDKKRDFAPGLALKLFRDGAAKSSNVSALYALEGQNKDYNFFKNPLSNIVPMGTDVGLKYVHSIFSRVTDYPEQLIMRDFSTHDVRGNAVSPVKYPKQIFFVPDSKLENKFSSSEHDFRKDILRIRKGSRVYKVYAVKGRSDFDYGDYRLNMIKDFSAKSATVHIGDLITTSEFVASKLGDDGLFFRHEMRPKTQNLNLNNEGK